MELIKIEISTFMITNFEEITKELNEQEMKLLPVLINGFKTKTKENPVKAPEIVSGMNSFIEETNIVNIKMSEVRLRKMTNVIRSKGLLPLIATSDGYFVSNDKEEIKLQIQSMEERASSILNAANGLRKFLN